jgi:hypothetical protein
MVTNRPSGVSSRFLDIERDHGPPEGAGEAQQQQGAVAQAAKRLRVRGHGNDDVAGRRFLADRSGADRAPDAGQDGLHALFGGRARLFGSAVEMPDGGEAPERRRAFSERGKKPANHLGRGRQRVEPAAAAPVLAQGRWRKLPEVAGESLSIRRLDVATIGPGQSPPFIHGKFHDVGSGRSKPRSINPRK